MSVTRSGEVVKCRNARRRPRRLSLSKPQARFQSPGPNRPALLPKDSTIENAGLRSAAQPGVSSQLGVQFDWELTTNAPMTPGTQPTNVKIVTNTIVPHPLSNTARGGNRIQSNARPQPIVCHSFRQAWAPLAPGDCSLSSCREHLLTADITHEDVESCRLTVRLIAVDS